MRQGPADDGGERATSGAARFEAVFNDPHVLMALLGPDGRIQRVNQTAIDLVRPDESDLVGTPFWEGPWWAHSERVRADVEGRVARAATGEYVEFELEYVTGDDERRITAGILRPVTDEDGDVVSIIASGRDITDHIHQEQRVDVLQRIIRHNFRNGLNVIGGHATEILSRLSADETAEPAEIERMTRIIGEEVSELGTSVEKIEQLERLAPAAQERVDVETVFDRVAERVRAAHPECTVDRGPPETEVLVPESMTVAVSEAVTNAVEHHPTSAPTIELSARLDTDSDPPHAEVHVADDGPGIPRTEAEPVLDGEETALTHTSGVGLWLIKWTVNQHGGDLSIASNDSRGSRITLRFPTPVHDGADPDLQ